MLLGWQLRKIMLSGWLKFQYCYKFVDHAVSEKIIIHVRPDADDDKHNKGNNKITELTANLQRESQNS
jgi:hypothetical protein